MKTNVCKTVSMFGITVMMTMSASPSMANPNTNNMSVDHLSWSQLPTGIQDYYQANAKTNTLDLSLKDIVAIRSWSSTEGDQYLVQLQHSSEANSPDQPSDELITHLYNIEGTQVRRVWQIYDHIPCDGLDVIASYAADTAVISDIDNDGVVEVSVPYYLGCRGDVSYDEMKIITYEGKQKFAIRGNSAICDSKTGLPVDKTGYYGGDYKIDEQLLQRAALSASQKTVFREHLKSVWRDNQCSIYFNYDD
ncbi:MAG: M949_RS01915 family surface polysaccharide biosynthesis protein [Psychrobacter sp.]|uniref:M949_RS01915 family surface polysaccharide biosynthesis protein n=1 Tax=Psychrobacter sp. TaxID=56811 RepID=UPI003F9B1040